MGEDGRVVDEGYPLCEYNPLSNPSFFDTTSELVVENK